MLKRLRCCILKYQEEIRSTLKHDLGKSRFESYMCETGLVLDELRYMLDISVNFQRKSCSHSPFPVCLQKLCSSLPLRSRAYYESLELSVSSEPDATGGCHCGRKYGHCQAKRLCSRYSGNRQQDYLRGFSAFFMQPLSQADEKKTPVF